MSAIVVLMLFSAAIASAAFVNRPSNVVALKGRRVELPCEVTKASYEFHWTFTPVGGNEVTIYSARIGVDEKHTGRMTVIEEERSRNLVIDSVQLENAGTYVCKVVSTNVRKESGQLIVLDGVPDCGSNLSRIYNSVMEGDFFQLSCNISFRAKWTPTMVCSQDGDNITRLSDDAWQHSSTTGRQSVTLTVTFVADRAKHDTLYSCRIFFAREHRVGGFPYGNVSYYTRSWISPRVNITYAPNELSISPEKQIYYPGERLTCYSDANPTPSLEWQELNTGRPVSGSSFPIKEYMTQEPISNLECIARNSMGTNRKRISFSVEKAPPEPNSNSLTSITVTVGSILSVFFVAMLVMLIVYHMHIKRIVAAGRQRRSNENSVMPPSLVENYEDILEFECPEESNPDDLPVDSRNDLANNDASETYTTIPETTYDDLTPRALTVLPTYSNLTIGRSPSSQLHVSPQINSMTTETEEYDYDE